MQAAPNRVSEYRRRAAENRAKARETTDKQASKELLQTPRYGPDGRVGREGQSAANLERGGFKLKHCRCVSLAVNVYRSLSMSPFATR